MNKLKQKTLPSVSRFNFQTMEELTGLTLLNAKVTPVNPAATALYWGRKEQKLNNHNNKKKIEICYNRNNTCINLLWRSEIKI